jgi:hypothetical protein
MTIIRRLYQRRAWDFTGIEDKEHRKILQGALDACDYSFYRIRKRTGKRVPVTVSDLSRFAQALDPATGHAHVHNEETGEHGHLLGEPPGFRERSSWSEQTPRSAALGLYWLPTPQYPAGRVEIDTGAMRDPDLAREVFLAEGAHAVDYGAMTDGQRVQVMALFDYKGAGPAPAGWFEEQGEGTYWRWRGERWMGLFTAAFAAGLPTPLQGRQPWEWSYDTSDVAAVRDILK